MIDHEARAVARANDDRIACVLGVSRPAFQIAELVGIIGAYSSTRGANEDELQMFVDSIMSGSRVGLPGLDVDYVIDARGRCGDGNSFVFHAASVSNLFALSMLIDSGGDVNAVNDCGEAAIHIASERGHALAVEYLIGQGAMVDPRTFAFGWSPLMVAVRAAWAAWAARGGGATIRAVDTIIALLRGGADVNKCDAFGITPMWFAASKGLFDIVVALRVGWVEGSGRLSDGMSAVDIAISKGYMDIANELGRSDL